MEEPTCVSGVLEGRQIHVSSKVAFIIYAAKINNLQATKILNYLLRRMNSVGVKT